MFDEALAAKRAVDAEIPLPGAKSEVDEAKRWFDAVIEGQEKLVGALGGVGDPPVELKEAHNDYFAAVSELLALNRRISDRLGDAGSDFDMAQLVNDPELGTAPQGQLGNLQDKACGALKDVARESVAGATLSCTLWYGYAGQ